MVVAGVAMIANKEIEQNAEVFSHSPITVEEDYVYGWLLKALRDFCGTFGRTTPVLESGRACS